jgi:glycosyltransferase involved in cell wall biosynthesis
VPRRAAARGQPSLSVIVATYEWPEALDLVLQALSEQRDGAFDVVVADDGSGSSTSELIERWRPRLDLAHVWQPDEGFRRARILNLAAQQARGDFLVFIDGDCLPRRRLVESMRRGALPRRFLAGKRLCLGRSFSQRVIARRVPAWRWSPAHWLLLRPRELRRPGLLLPGRDRRRAWRPERGEFNAPYDAYGSLLGVWRRDFERVNGFDMRFVGWGGEDTDIARRLRRAGLVCGWAGPRTTVVHLWHPSRASGRHNSAYEREMAATGRVEAEEGLRQVSEPTC